MVHDDDNDDDDQHHAHAHDGNDYQANRNVFKLKTLKRSAEGAGGWRRRGGRVVSV